MSEFISKIEHILTLLDDFLFSIMGGSLQIFFTADKNCCGRLEWEGGEG